MRNTKCIRSAIWSGNILPGKEDQFKQAMDDKLIPMIRTIPGVSNANALWPTLLEDNPPTIACQVLVEFASRDDLSTMLGSKERQAMRAHVIALKEMFDGTLSHIEFDLNT